MKKERTRTISVSGIDAPMEELSINEDHFSSSLPQHVTAAAAAAKDGASQDASTVFFRSVVFSPEVPIRLDYHGKSVNLDQVSEVKYC